MSADEEFMIDEEWVEEDFIDGDSYEEEVVEEGAKVSEVKPTNPLQRSSSNGDFSFDGSTIVEFDLGSYNGESSSGEGEPDNYEAACRELIKLIYPQGGSHDADDMIRRCDLRNLHRNLKQQHKFLIHTKKSLAESDGKLERWESFDDSNGAFSVEAVDQAIISFDEPLNEGETQHKFGINDEQKWPEMEDFANPWESNDIIEMNNENFFKNDDPISVAVEETQDQVMLEPQSESSAVPLIPWLERNADDPDDYEAACRELIPIVYKDEEESDPDTMLRRSDPKDLYRHLKHQHWYLVHSGAISENPPSKEVTDVRTSNYNQGPSLDDIWLGTEGDDRMQGGTQEISQDRIEDWSPNLAAMDVDPLVQAIGEFRKDVGQCGVVDSTLGKPTARTSKQGDMMNNTEETKIENEVEVTKWLDRYVDEPNDYEEAIRQLVAVLYSADDEYDVETSLSRSTPKDLYRHLKQLYWYREHMGTLPENAMEKSLHISNAASRDLSARTERSKLIATVRNRISLLKSTGVGETHRSQQSSAASATTSASTRIVVVSTQKGTDKPVASEKFEKDLSSLAVEDEMVGFDDIDSSEASSSLEPPPGYYSPTFIDDRKGSLGRPDIAEHNETGNLQPLDVSSCFDPRSVHSDENRSNVIQMDSTFHLDILNQLNQDKFPKLDEHHQVGGETVNPAVSDFNADEQPFKRGLTISEHHSNHINNEILEKDSGFVNSGLQSSKRGNFTDSERLSGSKRAKTDVGTSSKGNQTSEKPSTQGRHTQFEQDYSGKSRSTLNHRHFNEFMKLISEAEKNLIDPFESEVVEALQLASLQIEISKETEGEFCRPFDFSTSLAKGIMDQSLIRSASMHYRDGKDFPPDYTAALKHAAAVILDKTANFSKDGNAVMKVETLGGEEKRMRDNSSFPSDGVEENAGKQISTFHDVISTRTERTNADIDETNFDSQVGEVLVDEEYGVEMTITERSATDKDASSPFPVSATSELGHEDINQVGRTKTSITFDRVDMSKRQNRIEEELFSIVCDAEKILGEPIGEEMLAALILAATKTAHRKRYYNFIKDTINFLPSVAKAILENGLLEDAARHLGHDISLQYINALQAASDKAVDRNLDYKYMDSHAVTLSIVFPEKTTQAFNIPQSNLGSEEDVAALEPSQVEEKRTSETNEFSSAKEHVSNLLNFRAGEDGEERKLTPSNMIEVEEEVKLRIQNYTDTKEFLLSEYGKIDQAKGMEKERIERELDSRAKSRGLEHSRKETPPKEALLEKELKSLRENLSSVKERLQQERTGPDSTISGGDKNIGIFGMFGGRRRAMDLDKEKEQQAKLMQQKIREMELEHSQAQIEREIAAVQQQLDELGDQESSKPVKNSDSSLSNDDNLNTKQASLLGESRKLGETFLETKSVINERRNTLEKSRRNDEEWNRKQKDAIMATSETAINRHYSEMEGAHDKANEMVAANLELKAISPATNRGESHKHLIINNYEASNFFEDLAKEETKPSGEYGEGQRTVLIESENDGTTEVDSTLDPASIVSDHLEGANQPAMVHSSDVDSLSDTELFHPSIHPLSTKPLLQVAQNAQEEVMQKSAQSSLQAEEYSEEKEDTGGRLGDGRRSVADHLVGLNKPMTQSPDLESMAPSGLYDSSPPPRPGKSLIAVEMNTKEVIPDHCRTKSPRTQPSEITPMTKNIENAPRGKRKKILMLFSSTTIDRSHQTNQQRAVVILEALNIKFESLDGSDRASVEKRNELFSLSNLQGTYPQFFVVEGASTHFVGPFESIQDLADRGLLKSLVDDREEHYRQEFMELLERDEKGETVDEERLYHLQLYARRRVGEELSTSERFDLEEFERKETRLENAENSDGGILQRDEVNPDRLRREGFGWHKSSSLGSSSKIINDSESTSPEGWAWTNQPPVLQQEKSPSLQGHPDQPKSNTQRGNSSPDRLLSWRQNGKRMVAETLQASSSETLSKEAGDKPRETLELGDVVRKPENFVSSKTALPDKTDSISIEKKSRKQILAAKRKQIVESRRAKWGLRNELNASSNEKNKPKSATSSGYGSSKVGLRMDTERRKQRMAESKRLAEKTAKAQEARLAREAKLQKHKEQVKQNGRTINANLEEQGSAEGYEASSFPAIQKGIHVSSDGITDQKAAEGPLLVHLVKEVERLSGFISRYEKKLATTCKSILSVAKKNSQETDLKRGVDLGFPDVYNYVIGQPWFKELASDNFSRPTSVSKRGKEKKEDVLNSPVVAFNNSDDNIASSSEKPFDPANLKTYKLSKLGKQFIKIDGPGIGDTGRFLSSLTSREGWSKQQITERWSDISQLSGDIQSDRICKNIEDIMSFCSSSGFIE